MHKQDFRPTPYSVDIQYILLFLGKNDKKYGFIVNLNRYIEK